MTHRERFATAWRHQEPDRVPIELKISPAVREHPKAERLVRLIDEHADNLAWTPGPDFGFFGLPTEYTEEVVEEKPGEYRRLRRVHRTPAGDFTAVTYHPAHSDDYHWEQRFIATVDDMRRLAEAPLEAAPWDAEAHRRRVAEIGEAAFPIMGLHHPLGRLVRHATHEEIYAWFHTERELMHRWLSAANAQVIETLERMRPLTAEPIDFQVTAHEMLIPPWMGHALFDEYVFAYDREVNAAIHRRGGRLRIHCHGNCMDFLEKFVEMGVDAIEPLEAPPYADVDLAEAKRRVGDRMMLSGNVMSQDFVRETPGEVREEVRTRIRDAAPGGGYSLRTSGGSAGTGIAMTDETLERVLANIEAYLIAGLEFGEYPIRNA